MSSLALAGLHGWRCKVMRMLILVITRSVLMSRMRISRGRFVDVLRVFLDGLRTLE